jgi:hypothetical protein
MSFDSSSRPRIIFWPTLPSGVGSAETLEVDSDCGLRPPLRYPYLASSASVVKAHLAANPLLLVRKILRRQTSKWNCKSLTLRHLLSETYPNPSSKKKLSRLSYLAGPRLRLLASRLRRPSAHENLSFPVRIQLGPLRVP